MTWKESANKYPEPSSATVLLASGFRLASSTEPEVCCSCDIVGSIGIVVVFVIAVVFVLVSGDIFVVVVVGVGVEDVVVDDGAVDGILFGVLSGDIDVDATLVVAIVGVVDGEESDDDDAKRRSMWEVRKIPE